MNRSVHPAPAVVLLATVAVTACSGLTSSSDYDPARLDTMRTYQTWDWAYAKDGSVGDLRSSDRVIDDPLMDKQIRGMVESSLLTKGYHRVDGDDPDFRVGYHISMNGRMDVSYINTTTAMAGADTGAPTVPRSVMSRRLRQSRSTGRER